MNVIVYCAISIKYKSSFKKQYDKKHNSLAYISSDTMAYYTNGVT